MKFLKILAMVIVAFLFIIIPDYTFANQAACNPTDVKPEKMETRLASFAVAPDMIVVGENMIAKITVPSPISSVIISIPAQFEVVDYSPKVVDGGSAQAGNWSGNLPAGDYTVTLKAKHYTAGKWQLISYSATSGQGTGYGQDYFFTYYDTIPITIALSNRNEVPQTTLDVVRKVIITAVPDVKLTITTDKGILGKDISAKSNQSLTINANKAGEAAVYLFAKEKDKVTLIASSSDSCQDSTISQKFTVKRSDISRNIKTNYSWLWWLLTIVITIALVVLILLWIRKKKDREQNPLTENINKENPNNQL